MMTAAKTTATTRKKKTEDEPVSDRPTLPENPTREQICERSILFASGLRR